MTDLKTAKQALDNHIDKQRLHFYKPIQIAEILYHHRLGLVEMDINDLDSYRLVSRRWRDEVSSRLVGNVSTSSSRYQDDLFSATAVPIALLSILANYNARYDGIVETYIYHRIADKLGNLRAVYELIRGATVETFHLPDLLRLFDADSLRRSTDKVYEIVVYALFLTLIDALETTITLKLNNPDGAILNDFQPFIETVLGITGAETTLTLPVALYRAGVANAADRGLDIWANFGPVVQVKHITLTVDKANAISQQMAPARMVIVCKSAEADLIRSVLAQAGVTIDGIITQDDLESWYSLCLTRHSAQLGRMLLHTLKTEFLQEFPHVGELDDFLEARGYRREALTGKWVIAR